MLRSYDGNICEAILHLWLPSKVVDIFSETATESKVRRLYHHD